MQVAPVRFTLGNVSGPHLADGKRGQLVGLHLGGGVSFPLGLLRQCVTFQVAGVFAIVDQPLQCACLVAGLLDAPRAGVADGQAQVFALVHALEDIGWFPGGRGAQPQPGGGCVPQERLRLVGGAGER